MLQRCCSLCGIRGHVLRPLDACGRALLVLQLHRHDGTVSGADAPHTLCSFSIDSERVSFDADVKNGDTAHHSSLSEVENA